MNADRPKLLAIDDNQDNLTALRAVVRDVMPGAEVLTASSGAEGLALTKSCLPDMILLDVVMPGMDGLAVCRALKADERLRDVPVLFLTAVGSDPVGRIHALEAGAEGFLSKPWDEAELIAQIRAMTKLKVAHQHQRRQKEELEALVAERTHALEQELGERRRAEDRIRSQLEELQRWQDVMLGREDRIQELKLEVNTLCQRLGEPPRYPSQGSGATQEGPRGREETP
jgi:response regulator RpfG family c-di-GMP phosphodiesterase